MSTNKLALVTGNGCGLGKKKVYQEKIRFKNRFKQGAL